MTYIVGYLREALLAGNIELPALIKLDMAEDSFRKAIQQNFDHLSGVMGQTRRDLDPLVGGNELTETIKEVISSTDIDAVDPELREVLIDAGVGSPDGVAPGTPTNLRAVGGIGNWFIVIWTGVANSSPVTYEVHVHTTNGFTPATDTLYGTFLLPGGDTLGTLTIRDFPTGHVLDGTAADPPNKSTTYYIKVIATDADGSGVATGQVSVTPIEVPADSILAAGTIVANLIGAGEIVAEHIAADELSGDHIEGGTIGAVTITAADINGGTIDGVTITGSTVRTSSGQNRIELGGPARADSISIYRGANGEISYIVSSGTDKTEFRGATGGSILEIAFSAAVTINGGSGGVTINGPRFATAPSWTDATNDAKTNPGVGAGAGEAIPGSGGTITPAIWVRIITPAGTSRWVPAF